ncbi:Uncharacterized protein FKW44_010963 [Caligus rogercresseyi]|uniref:Uncharacterized protein n=1 Tax=Caligus rogercresseyi TaxID=217165 RepID=A0A7T8K9E3_CALRO|nr:Uncharacterized protein FKW44_010963 [Caligus rogercresseyi]
MSIDGKKQSSPWFRKHSPLIQPTHFDLNDLLRRDPTLSSLSANTLSKGIPPLLIWSSEYPYPRDEREELNNLDEIFRATPDGSGTQTFGSSYSSGFETSPLGPTIVKMEMGQGGGGMFYEESKHTPTLAQLNSPPLEASDFAAPPNAELNWDSFFTSDEARNQPTIKSEDILSSSVPAEAQNSPLTVSPSVIGPPPRSASFSGPRPSGAGGPGVSPHSQAPRRSKPAPPTPSSLPQIPPEQQLSKSALPSTLTWSASCDATGARPHINSVCSRGAQWTSPTDLPDIASDDEDPDQDDKKHGFPRGRFIQ